MSRLHCIMVLALSCAVNISSGQQAYPVSNGFQKTKITGDFISEGVAVADLNKDGKPDIIAGYNWFEGPTYKIKREFAPSRIFNPVKEYADCFLNLAMDVNLDGWDDAVIIPYPGTPGYWFENPKNKPGAWKKHFIAFPVGIGNESPGFIDMDGDGRLDILCADVTKKQIVWLQAPTKRNDTTWKRFAISSENVPGTDRYSHGIGLGDVNQDGIKDVVIREGWFEGSKDLGSGNWPFHPANLGEPCSHMQVFDLNGDGKNDVLTASAHAMGIWWYEQTKRDNDSIDFKTHIVSQTTSQTHSSIMTDLNGDGQKDFITGKRFLAHNGKDAGDSAAPVIMWMEITKGKEPSFKEHIIDEDSGIGLNIGIHDMNGDKKPDIIIANKRGVFVFVNHLKKG